MTMLTLLTFQLLLGMLVFCAHVSWRRSWRLAALPVAALLLDLLYTPLILPWDVPDISVTGIAIKSLYFTACCVVMAAALHCCASVTWLESMIIVVAGYSLQHISYNLFGLVVNAWHSGKPSWLYSVTSMAILLTVCGLAYLCVGRNFSVDEEKTRSRIGWVAACMAAIVLMVVLSMVFVQKKSVEVQTVGYVYDSICVVLLLALLVLASANSRLYNDLMAMRQVDRLKAQHYELAKENIDLINIRCHDIRKMVGSLYADDGRIPTADMINKVQENIRIYDAMFHTGNDSLDVLLTEKSLYCSAHGITFTCIADGGKLGFMDSSDLYSLFGNIIDNAIESVQQIANPSQRIINISVCAAGQLLVIREDNYYSDDRAPVMHKGVPVTSKPDTINHGFGMRSIAWQVHRYQGEMTITTDDNVFAISIVLPIPN
ncbi:ATP-binding protein [Bifidobacterium reuteri]|nr:ATP-binding protein [Bifidobacterium reuteri]